MSTGQIAGGVVGAVAGFFIGGGPTGALYGAQIGIMAGGYLDPPKGPTQNGPRLNDLSVQTSTYGAVIPRVYGTVTVNGNIFWLENNSLKETVTKKKSGGKGGGSKTTTRTYTYSATFAVGLCKGPIAGVRRIWIGPDLIYDAGSADANTIAASNAAASGFAIYNGTDTQSADARMQATLGAANTPAWRGLAYIVFYDLPLARYGNSLMGAQVRVEVISKGSYAPIATLSQIPAVGSQYQWSPGFGSFGGVAISKAPSPTNLCMTTVNGLDWSAGTLPVSRYWSCIHGNGTRVCAVAGPSLPDDCRAIVTSDGINWTSTGITYLGWSAVTHNGAVWCIGGNGSVTVSANDGINWTDHAVAGMPSAPTCAFAHNGRLLLSNEGSSTYATSDDNGVNWTSRTFPFGANTGLRCAASNGSILIGIVKATDKCSISTDGGTTWGAPAVMVSGQSGWLDIEYGPGTGFFLASLGSKFAVSTDGVTWSLTSLPTTYDSIFSLDTMAWTGSKWSVVPTSTSTDCYVVAPVMSSVDDTLADIVSAECLQSGLLSAGDIDVTALASTTVRGYRIGSVGAIRSALEPLQAAWPFDVVQHGYQIRFVARGVASVVTIPAADLDARGAGQQPGVQITSSREMDSQLHRRVTVQHLDYDREYNSGTQYAERLNTAAINATILDLPIVLTATEAAGKAEVLLYLYWLERYDVAVNLPPTYNQLEPGDVVTLITPEGNVSLRLTAIHYTSDGRLECKAKYSSAAIYTPTAIGASPAISGPTTITPVGASVYVLMDLPHISSAQDGPSFLAAMTGALAGWDGGVLMQSTDAGGSWSSLHDFGPPGSAMGTCGNSLGSVDHRVIDNASLLSVTLTQGELFSVTQLAMLGGANHFAYGADGRWEIIAAQTCALVSGTTYTLSNLLRGRFGSEQYMSTHANGDSLILLDTTDVAAIVMGTGTIGLSYLYRGITVDLDISTDSNLAFTYRGVNLKPLSPIALTGNRDASNDWSLTWIRRTRDGGEWRDNVDASLGETSEAYQIDVYADGTYATVKRTISTTAPVAAYTSAEQTTDFGSNQATLYLKIYQISATVGRGYPLTQSLTR